MCKAFLSEVQRVKGIVADTETNLTKFKGVQYLSILGSSSNCSFENVNAIDSISIQIWSKTEILMKTTKYEKISEDFA
jgi:hypothetical protein